jgi:hypothetical protein
MLSTTLLDERRSRSARPILSWRGIEERLAPR